MFWRKKEEEKYIKFAPEFKIGDKLLYYYTYPDYSPYNGCKGIVSFIVEEIHFTGEYSEKYGVEHKESYVGGKFGCNYYGEVPAHLVAKDKVTLIQKLVDNGYELNLKIVQ